MPFLPFRLVRPDRVFHLAPDVGELLHKREVPPAAPRVRGLRFTPGNT